MAHKIYADPDLSNWKTSEMLSFSIEINAKNWQIKRIPFVFIGKY